MDNLGVAVEGKYPINIDRDNPGHYESHIRQMVWRDLQGRLFDFLISNRSNGYAVFFKDNEFQVSEYEKVYKAWFEITKVEQRNVPLVFPNYQTLDYKQLTSSAIGELKSRIRLKIIMLFTKRMK